ncbi:MAG: DUF362 domain-containing protein [Armatimonadota bacterium]
MADRFTRREFLKRAAAIGVATAGLGELSGLDGLSAEAASAPVIAVASKKDPARLVRAAVDALGGMRAFVKKGDDVLVKPNMGWARRPEQAATTNPEVVAEIVRLCREAGARRISVLDHAVDRPDSLLLRMTGIADEAKKAGARVAMASSPTLYEKVELRGGKALRSADVMRDLLRADVFINVPIAKVHNSTTLTLGMKNLLGIVWDRGALHRSSSLDQAIVDLATQFRPHLTILDAVRILLTNGPKGPGRTEDRKIVVAGTDVVAVDAYGASLFGMKPSQIAHIKLAGASGRGEADLRRVRVVHC